MFPVARDWARKLGQPTPWPGTLAEWLTMCHAAGQTKPTPILLRYREGDWIALHRDLYGDLMFPLQVVVGLDQPHVDHSGGEFLMVEQRPRAQSRGDSTTLAQGHAIIFATRDRPVQSARLVGRPHAARGQQPALGDAPHPGPGPPRRRLTVAWYTLPARTAARH